MVERKKGSNRQTVSFTLDGATAQGLEGDTLLTAIATLDEGPIGHSDFSHVAKNGFCLMGVCQDCWVDIDGRRRVRSCMTLLTEGLSVSRPSNFATRGPDPLDSIGLNQKR